MAHGLEADPVTVTIFLLLFVGIAGAGLVAARWRDAVERGTPLLVTQAGRMSQPILERVGFRRVCEIRILLDEFGASSV